jgi:predicted nucleic acid-binding protein
MTLRRNLPPWIAYLAAMTLDYVSDTGPLISFERIPDGFLILRRLVRRIIIPMQVYDELSAGAPSRQDYIAAFGLADFIETTQAPSLSIEADGLHPGESHAIQAP